MFKLFRFLWSDISKRELAQFGILSLSLLFLISAIEILRPIKDVIFLVSVGKAFLPYAKMASLVVLILLLMVYGKLVDWLEKHHLVYFLNSLISLFIFSIATIFIQFPNIYSQPSIVAKFIGWVTFIGCECSIVLLLTLYWSFLASSMDTVTAKKGYPPIVAGARIGSVIGPIMVLNVTKIGINSLLLTAGICVFSAALSIFFFTSLFSTNLAVPTHPKNKATGAFEGLTLLAKHPYLTGIFLISILPDIIGEILQFSMLFLAESTFKTPDKIIEFLGIYGIVVSCITLIVALLGTSFFLRTWGLAAWLLLYPLIISVIVLYIWLFHSLWTMVIGMALLKSLCYAVDQPCRDIMFIPTSRDIMFKSRSWIGAFGARFARGVSAGFVAVFSGMGSLIFYGSITSFCLVGLWIPIARYVGNVNNKLVQEGKILE